MRKFAFLSLLLTVMIVAEGLACTNFIVTKGASTDGSVLVSYSADSHTLYGALYKYNAPKGGNAPGTMVRAYNWETGDFLIEIPQVANSYSTVGNVNEHQLIIAETTFGGRPELTDPDGKLDYGSLIWITLQRAKTPREAILTIAELANEYGYCKSGESFSIADPNEAWIMEFIGKGSKIENGVNVNKGIVWVARRIPDGYVSAHANQARITQFPKDDPENCLYAPDVISFAREMGYYDGTDEDFSFSDTYNPLSFSGMRGCEARVWSWFNMITDGMDQYLDYAMGHNPKNRMPLWVKPTHKVSPKQTFDGMRDHYEGTALDMTKDIGAGGEENPYRWRPMNFEVDGKKYVNERAIATQQSGFWFVAQARDWLADPIGCILWFGVDDAATSSLTPIYCSIDDVPESLREGNGSMTEYSPTAAFWVYNRVAHFAYLRYNLVGKEVREVIDQWENEKLQEVLTVDQKATEILNSQGKDAVVRYLTDYSVGTAQAMFDKWVKLDQYLLVKYIDGNVKKEDANGFVLRGGEKPIPVAPDQPGYTEKWKRAVAADHGATLLIPE